MGFSRTRLVESRIAELCIRNTNLEEHPQVAFPRCLAANSRQTYAPQPSKLALEVQADDRREALTQLRHLFAKVPHGPEVDELERISNHLFALGYGNDQVVLDLSVARGLAYYTGPVFEAVLLGASHFGPVFGGGRYDELVTTFRGERVRATGGSIGVDRLVAAMRELGRLNRYKSTSRVLVMVFDTEMIGDYLAMAFELRRNNVPTELYLGPEQKLGRQLRYADACDIPVALIYGADEKEKGVVTLKDMRRYCARRTIARARPNVRTTTQPVWVKA